MGDINFASCSDLTGKRLNNDREKRQLILPNLYAGSGDEFLIPVYITDFQNQLTLGLNLQFNPDYVELLDIENGFLTEWDENDYSVSHDRKGMMTLIWFTMQKEGHSCADDKPLFYIKAKAIQDIKGLEPLVRLTYQRLENRMFAVDGKQFDLSLKFVKDSMKKGALESDRTRPVSFYPNPFTESFTLELQSNKAERATIRLISIEGRILRTFEREVVKGFNRIGIENMEELPKGYIVYEIVIADEIFKGKILKQ